MINLTIALKNKKGLHARASSLFVKCVNNFNAQVMVSFKNQTVNGDSIMSLLSLGAPCNSLLTITSIGPQSRRAIEALKDLIENKFEEEE